MSSMKYLRSAVLPKDYPPMDRPEVAVAGRSNAGKSSFINSLANSKVALVSQNPGKTRLLNFFDFGVKYRFVDMPGYGWASRGEGEKESWQQMIETYLTTRENLKGLVLLMDLRREWTPEEEMLKKFTEQISIPLCVVLTKSDKVSKREIGGFKERIIRSANTKNVFVTSAEKKVGIKDVEEFIYREWILE
jgi:GTP-binding protein